jgi:hypothetical protein
MRRHADIADADAAYDAAAARRRRQLADLADGIVVTIFCTMPSAPTV